MTQVFERTFNHFNLMFLFLQDGENSLKFFRGVELNEINENVKNEFASIQSLNSVQQDGTTKVTIKDFRKILSSDYRHFSLQP